MTHNRLFSASLLAAVLGATVARTAPEPAPAPRPGIDITGYKNIAQAIKANPKEFNFSSTTNSTPAGWLGVVVGEKNGKPVVDAVAPESPAETAGLKEGDIVVQIDEQKVAQAAEVRDILRGKLSGDKLKMTVARGGSPVVVMATLKPASKPMVLGTSRAVMGVTLGDPGKGGIKLAEVEGKGPADQAGLKAGDVILSLDGRPTQTDTAFRDSLANKQPGDRVDVAYSRDGKQADTKVFVMAETVTPKGGGGFGGGWDDRIPRAWRKPTYKLAILGVEYTDVKHNAKIKDGDWEESMFSLGTYTGNSATGQKVYGSMNDYYKELSYGTFKVEGKFIGWVEVSKKRMDYSSGSGTSAKEKTALLTESLDVFTKKNGKDSLKEYDGIFFLYAGDRVNTTRGGLYWPHRANVRYDGRSLPYFIVQEGGNRMNDISVFCHEFGHMLGLPGPVRAAGAARQRGRVAVVRHVEPDRQRPPAALLRLEQGTARVGQADGHRPAGEAEARARPDRGRSDAVLQGDGASLTAASTILLESAEEDRMGFAVAGRGAARLARGEQQADPGGVARDRGRTRAERVPDLGAVPQCREQQLHAVHDAVEQEPARRRAAGVGHEHPQAARWPRDLPHWLRVSVTIGERRGLSPPSCFGNEDGGDKPRRSPSITPALRSRGPRLAPQILD